MPYLDNLYRPQTEEEVVNEENQTIDPEVAQMLQEAYEAGIRDGYEAAFAEDETVLDEGVKEALQKAGKKIKLFAQNHPKVTRFLGIAGGSLAANALMNKVTGRTFADDIDGSSGKNGYNRAMALVTGGQIGEGLAKRLSRK